MRSLPSSIFFGNKPISLAYHSKINTMEASQNWRFYFEVQSTILLAQVYGWKEDNICQSIWDKSEVLWRTCWGTHWELIKGNIVRTHWEPGENEKKIPAPTPKLIRKKSKAPWVHAWAFPLVGMKFLFTKEFLTIFGLG
jgi:hypothetical protein